MKRKALLVVLSIVLLAVTIGTVAGDWHSIGTPTDYEYCPFCPPSSDTPEEPIPTPTPIPIHPPEGQYKNPNLIAYIDELKDISISSNPNVVIVDVRSPEEYAEGHIPGAINLEWREFIGAKGVFKGVEKASEILGAHGISQENGVIVYCESTSGNTCPASAYVFWMLEYLGHENVSVLDGGLGAWKTTYVCTKSVTTKLPTTYTANKREERFAGTEWVQNNLDNPKVQIVDARRAEEYNAGHIEGAINLDYEKLFRDGHRMKGADELKYLFLGKGLDKSKDTVVYCRSGARSSYLYLALRMMGYQVRNYDGSWTIWSETHPVPSITILNVTVNPSFAYKGTWVEISAEVDIPSLRSENGTGTSTRPSILGYTTGNAGSTSKSFPPWFSSISPVSPSSTSTAYVRAYIHKEEGINEVVAMNDYDGDGKYAGEWQTFLAEDGTYAVDIEATDGVIKTEKKNAAAIEVATDIVGPSISNVNVSPPSAPPGSRITISADISDPSGVLSVTALIKRNDETLQIIPLSDPDRDGRYSGEWKSPRSAKTGTYHVSVTATDGKWNKAENENAADFVIERVV